MSVASQIKPQTIRAVTFNTACSVIGAAQAWRAHWIARDTLLGRPIEKYPRDSQLNAKSLADLKADVVALQEICPEDLSVFQALFPHHHVSFPFRPSHENAIEEVAIFMATKNPSQVIELGNVPPVFLGLSGLRDEKLKISYFHVHAQRSRKNKIHQETWDYLLGLIAQEQTLGNHVILLGDFNAGLTAIQNYVQAGADKQAFIPALTGDNTFKLTLGGFTIPNWVIHLESDTDIDNCLFFPANPNTKVTSKAEVRPDIGTDSDHFAVTAEFVIQN